MRKLFSKLFDYPAFWCVVFALSCYLISSALPIVEFSAKILALFLLGIGVAILVWAIIYFRSHHTSVHPQGSPQTLITGGPFRINRNPIYTGMFLLVLAFGIAGGGISGVIFSVAFPIVITKRFILHEERLLQNTFPDGISDYLQSTRRW